MSDSKSPQGPSTKSPKTDNRRVDFKEQSAEPAAQDQPPEQQDATSSAAIGEAEPASTELKPSATSTTEPEPSAADKAAAEHSDVTAADTSAADAVPYAAAQESPAEGAPASNSASKNVGSNTSNNASSNASGGGPGGPTKPSAPAKPGPGTGRVVVIAAVVAAVISGGVFAAGSYYFDLQQQRQTQEQAQAQLGDVTQQVERQQQALGELRSAVEQRGQMQQQLEGTINETRQQLQQLQPQLQNRLEQQNSQISRLQDRVDGHQQRLTNLSTTSREDWLLAEAEYLLKLANQRVLLERLPTNAIALLEAADVIVKQVAGGMGDAELFAVREALANELAALKGIEPVDKEGIYLRLNSLASSVDELPRVPGHSFEQPAQQAEEAPQPQPQATEGNDGNLARVGGWLQSAWDEVKGMAGMLDDYIKIEDATAPVKPLVDQYTAQVVGLNVRLLLEQAQVALLKEQPVAYRQSLEQAQALVDEYFIESSSARELRRSLEQLQEVDIAPQLPDISGSLKMLNNYIRQLHKLQPAAEGQL